MNRRGFSLLELTVVLTIVGILLALGAPRFLARARAGCRAFGHRGSWRHAVDCPPLGDPAPRAWSPLPSTPRTGSVQVRTGSQVILRRALGVAYGIVLAANRDSVVYDPRGLGYGLANLTVTVRSGAIVDTLTMSRLGRVRW